MTPGKDRLPQIDAWLDGSLAAEDVADFAAWLATDDQAPALLAEKSLVHSWLIDHHVAPVAVLATGPTPTLRRTRSIWYFAAAAAALISLVITAWFLLSPEPPTPNPAPSVARSVALLTNTENAVFGDCTIPTALGSALPPGALRLTSGSAQVMFNSGAVVDLTAPATLHILSDNTARLDRGDLYATVLPAAAGFTVHGAQGLKVIDLGTEFSMHVAAGRGAFAGDCEVRVYVGHVQLEARSGMHMTLAAGQGARYAGGALAPTPVVVPQNALANGGFDSADGFDHWTIFGPGIDEQQCRAAGAWPQWINRDGNGLIRMPIRTLGDNHVTGLFQDVPVAPGDRCRGQIKIMHTDHEPIAGAEVALCKLEFYDADARHIVQYESTSQLASDFPVNEPLFATVAAVAPPGAVAVRFVLIANDPQSSNAGAVLFDDASLWINPPSSTP